jgi:hypothetical protein
MRKIERVNGQRIRWQIIHQKRIKQIVLFWAQRALREHLGLVVDVVLLKVRTVIAIGVRLISKCNLLLSFSEFEKFQSVENFKVYTFFDAICGPCDITRCTRSRSPLGSIRSQWDNLESMHSRL